MVIIVWVLTVAALAGLYWAFRVNQDFRLRMLVLTAVGGVYLLGILQGMDAYWFNGTTAGILVIAFWPAPAKAAEDRVPPPEEPRAAREREETP